MEAEKASISCFWWWGLLSLLQGILFAKRPEFFNDIDALEVRCVASEDSQTAGDVAVDFYRFGYA